MSAFRTPSVSFGSQTAVRRDLSSVTLWLASTLLLRLYEQYFSSSPRIYGELNTVATLLLWLYLTGAAIFVGGEANSEIEKAAAQAGHSDVRKAGERRSGGEHKPSS